MNDNQIDLDLLFETSWEVCNKLGGIYTVLSTKAKTLQSIAKDKTIFIGPDVWTKDNPSPYFKESQTLFSDWKTQSEFPDGIKVRVGRWEIPGRPIAILVRFNSEYALKDSTYSMMWQQFGVDSLHAYGDYDEGCAFAVAAAKVIENFVRYYRLINKRIIAHFDEWTTGMGLLYVRHALPTVATVFTTHATCIGRSICGNGKPLYDYLQGYNGNQMAMELNMESKHSLEKTAAHVADCFTTVSDITAKECDQLLERNPNVTPNGFEQNFVPKGEAYTIARDKARNTILSRIGSLTGQILPEDTFIVATSGRLEYRNKGIDLMLEASARLRGYTTPHKILVLIMVPGWSNGCRRDILDADKQKPLPDPTITHILNNPNEDPVINRIHQIGFGNTADDNVNVVYVPCYLNGDDGIFNMSYYDILPGMDATVFPSYYEPWG
ncbi:MAG: glycogen/starch synthase, partial [Muribaculum sp.]|nr:glycogen/starch synthase [Muribaculum sp.]